MVLKDKRAGETTGTYQLKLTGAVAVLLTPMRYKALSGTAPVLATFMHYAWYLPPDV